MAGRGARARGLTGAAAPTAMLVSGALARDVSIPLWIAVAGGLLALWAALDHLLVPSVRWFLRRRVDRLLEGIRTRLKIDLPPFKTTRRAVLIDRLLFDPEVQQSAAESAREQGLPRDVVLARVRRYAKEIVPNFNAYAYFRLGYSAARSVARKLYRVRLGYADEAGLARVHASDTVVFLINHRSNMDYVLVAYLVAERAAISYAVGEWARVWPLQTLVRAMGAYFVRRDSRDPLYRKVLERYVAMATAAGVAQAVFPEGGLSRDGKLRAPKLGILDYMIRSFDLEGERDIVFVPVGVNYDRVFEDRSLLLDLSPEARRLGAPGSFATTARFAAHNLWLMARNRWHRFGYACVAFGTPVSAREYARARGLDFRRLSKDDRRQKVEAFGRDLMGEVARVIPVVPVALVATAFVADPRRAWSELELKAEALRRMRELDARGAHVYIPRGDQDYAIDVGLRMLTLRRLVEESEGLFRPVPAELPLLSYYANSIAHFFGSEAAGS
ncbi:MAG TPA: 1-acyl-sn-glycerol-3-phosphate acyltransferase [Thermoanaerobaculia bacterium]|nr:1-acyl-sn-glycerol-3-phosphate acyltransferase [Thermoanaerobaculia bacterium]